MRRCCLCKKKQGENESFFRIPKDDRRRNKWIQFCKAKFASSSVICKDHFAPSDIVEARKPFLLPGAVPLRRSLPVEARQRFLLPGTVPLRESLTDFKLSNPTICNQSAGVPAQVPSTRTEPNIQAGCSQPEYDVLIGPTSERQLPTTAKENLMEIIELPVRPLKKCFKEQATQTDPVIITEVVDYIVDNNTQYEVDLSSSRAS